MEKDVQVKTVEDTLILGNLPLVITQYLVEYIQQEKINNPYPWVDEQTFGNIINAVKQVGRGKMKPIFDFLNGEIYYNQIRISIACLRSDALVPAKTNAQKKKGDAGIYNKLIVGPSPCCDMPVYTYHG